MQNTSEWRLNNLQALIKRFFEWVLRLKLNSIAFLGYKQMKIANMATS